MYTVNPPITPEDCRRELERLRRDETESDGLEIEAIDPASGNVVDRFGCMFRAPSYAEPGDGEASGIKRFHLFMSQNHEKGMKFKSKLTYTNFWDKHRDYELSHRAEQQADDDAEIDRRIEEEQESR